MSSPNSTTSNAGSNSTTLPSNTANTSTSSVIVGPEDSCWRRDLAAALRSPVNRRGNETPFYKIPDTLQAHPWIGGEKFDLAPSSDDPSKVYCASVIATGKGTFRSPRMSTVVEDYETYSVVSILTLDKPKDYETLGDYTCTIEKLVKPNSEHEHDLYEDTCPGRETDVSAIMAGKLWPGQLCWTEGAFHSTSCSECGLQAPQSVPCTLISKDGKINYNAPASQSIYAILVPTTETGLELSDWKRLQAERAKGSHQPTT